MLLKLRDGGIIKFEQDNWCAGEGCYTCGYGSSYITEMDIVMTRYKVELESDEMYEYGLSDGIVMEVILNNVNEIQEMSEYEFSKWIIKEFETRCDLNKKTIVEMKTR